MTPFSLRLRQAGVVIQTATLLLTARTILAADPTPETPNQRPPGAGAGPNRPGPGGPARPMDIGRILNDEQREEFRNAMQGNREKMRAIEEKSARLRREIEEAVMAETLDEKAIRDRTRELSDLEAERILLRARAIAKIRPSLTPEQLQKMKEMVAEMGNQRRMDRPGMRPGVGPGGREPLEPAREGSDLPPPRRNGPKPESPQ